MRLGVDLPDVPETIFRFGKCDEGWAVRFVENPWFPAPVFSLSLSDSLDEWLKC